MDGEHRQTNVEVRVLIIYLTKSENAIRNFHMKMKQNTNIYFYTFQKSSNGM